MGLPRAPRSESCLAAVGPEGGWTREEMAQAQEKGFRTLGLGHRILRTETAAVTTAAILQEKWGDLGSSRQSSVVSRQSSVISQRSSVISKKKNPKDFETVRLSPEQVALCIGIRQNLAMVSCRHGLLWFATARRAVP